MLAVRRRGKYLLIDCRRDGVEGSLIIHLGMSGKLRFMPPGSTPEKHDHFDLLLPDQILRFTDPRRFGVVLWQPGPPETTESHRCSTIRASSHFPTPFKVDWLYAAIRSAGTDQIGADGQPPYRRHRQHLCRRKPVPGGHFAAARRQQDQPGTLRAARPRRFAKH